MPLIFSIQAFSPLIFDGQGPTSFRRIVGSVQLLCGMFGGSGFYGYL